MEKTETDWMHLLVKDYRWPKKGDRLLRDSDDWRRGVDFPRDRLSRDVNIWDGYMSAGAVLVEACKGDPHERHCLVYPILFNYRHGVELAMKWTIAQYGRYSSVNIENTMSHDLWQLWKVCKQVIIQVGSNDETITIVEQIIKDFHDIDKTALAFRYSRDKNGALIALPDMMIDLEHVRDIMEGVSHFFDGVDGQLDANSSAMDW